MSYTLGLQQTFIKKKVMSEMKRFYCIYPFSFSLLQIFKNKN